VREVLDDAARARLVANIVGHVGKTRVPEIRERAIQYWKNVDAGLGALVEAGLAPIAEPRTSLASEPVRTPAVF
jgi:catalase